MHVKCVALVNDVCTFLIPGLCPVS
jgi:hypothetical protein